MKTITIKDAEHLRDILERACNGRPIPYDIPGLSYGSMCRKPELCKDKGYCPLDPTCGD